MIFPPYLPPLGLPSGFLENILERWADFNVGRRTSFVALLRPVLFWTGGQRNRARRDRCPVGQRTDPEGRRYLYLGRGGEAGRKSGNNRRLAALASAIRRGSD